jgi:hypothetical protein
LHFAHEGLVAVLYLQQLHFAVPILLGQLAHLFSYPLNHRRIMLPFARRERKSHKPFGERSKGLLHFGGFLSLCLLPQLLLLLEGLDVTSGLLLKSIGLFRSRYGPRIQPLVLLSCFLQAHRGSELHPELLPRVRN